MSEFTDIPEDERTRRTRRVYVSEAYDTSAAGINKATQDDLVEAITDLAQRATDDNEVLMPASIHIGPMYAGAYADEHGRTGYEVAGDSVTVDIWKAYQPSAQRRHGTP